MKSFTPSIISKAIIVGAAAMSMAAPAIAKNTSEKPNIVVIMADDIGYWNTSAYNNGMMGYKTPNIDRIAKAGILFTDHYAQPSSTAGRAAFLTGQYPIRTGLTTVGLPGSPIGLQPEDPTIAEILKEQGYMTNQLGKNHMGDQEYMLPHRRGFDNFYGNLYHLNAEDEPENPDYPKDPAFKERFGPKGIVTGTADGPTGSNGPLTKKRMETIDQELTGMAVDYIGQQAKSEKPFFLWYNPSRMHVWTRLAEKWQGASGHGVYGDGMMELDHHVGEILDSLEKTGQKDNTIVIFTTDNGAEKFTWPDGGNTPFKGEKGMTTEGGVRVPMMVMWPGKIPANVKNNGIQSHEDLFTTLLTISGEKNIQENFKTEYKVHIDGIDQSEAWFNNTDTTRNVFPYFNDTGGLEAIRIGNIKTSFTQYLSDDWFGGRIPRQMPQFVDLRADPFESAPEHSGMYTRWMLDRLFNIVPVQVEVGKLMKSFKEFPVRQKPAGFNIDAVFKNLPVRDAK